MSEVHEQITTDRTTYIQPPPADSTPDPISNSVTLNVEPVLSSQIEEPDNSVGTNSTNGTHPENAPYQPSDSYTQNRSIGQISPLNWTKPSWT